MQTCTFCNKTLRQGSPSRYTCEACRNSDASDSIWLRQTNSNVWQVSTDKSFADHEQSAFIFHTIEVPCTRAQRAQFFEICMFASDTAHLAGDTLIIDIPTLLINMIMSSR